MSDLLIGLRRGIASTGLYGPAFPFEAAAVKLGFSQSVPSVERRERLYPAMTPEERAAEVKRLYRCWTGRDLDLDNPRTLGEKLQWLKLYGGSPLRTRLIDKLAAREWVAERVGERYVVPLLGSWERFDDIDFDALPGRFALKCNHGAGYNIIVHDKDKLDRADAKEKIEGWLGENYAYRHMLELQYEDVRPMVFAEEYMENAGGDIYDYKFYCYDGKPLYIQFLCDRATGLRMAYFDKDWVKQPFHNKRSPLIMEEVPRPDNLDEMLGIAAALSEGFPFVRVDLYRLDDGTIRFGEMTFIPAGGFITWEPESTDLLLGAPLTLPGRGEATR